MRGHFISAKLAATRVSPLVHKPVKTPHTCLTCGRTFLSTGVGNRRCDRCTNYEPKDKLG